MVASSLGVDSRGTFRYGHAFPGAYVAAEPGVHRRLHCDPTRRFCYLALGFWLVGVSVEHIPTQIRSISRRYRVRCG